MYGIFFKDGPPVKKIRSDDASDWMGKAVHRIHFLVIIGLLIRPKRNYCVSGKPDRPNNICCSTNEPVIYSHYVHLKLGHRFHALLKVCSRHDNIVPF